MAQEGYAEEGEDMTLIEDLIAARALIDTPEKLERLGIVGAITAATVGETRTAAIRAIKRAGIVGNSFRNHPFVMSVFDRAIEAAK